MTPLEYALVFVVSIMVIIYGLSRLESMYSRRERGLPKRRRRRIGRRKGDHE